jgi:hypothetical protein
MKGPTDEQLEEMIQAEMDGLRKESGGDFDEYASAFFKTGFKCGVRAMLLREFLSKMPTDDRREN